MNIYIQDVVTLTRFAPRAFERGRSVGVLWQDLGFGCRVLAKNRGFTTVIVLTIAVGIGGISIMFAVGNAIWLRPLAFTYPARLEVVVELEPKRDRTRGVATL